MKFMSRNVLDWANYRKLIMFQVLVSKTWNLINSKNVKLHWLSKSLDSKAWQPLYVQVLAQDTLKSRKIVKSIKLFLWKWFSFSGVLRVFKLIRHWFNSFAVWLHEKNLSKNYALKILYFQAKFQKSCWKVIQYWCTSIC